MACHTAKEVIISEKPHRRRPEHFRPLLALRILRRQRDPTDLGSPVSCRCNDNFAMSNHNGSRKDDKSAIGVAGKCSNALCNFGSIAHAGISRRPKEGAAASIVRRYAVHVGLAGQTPPQATEMVNPSALAAFQNDSRLPGGEIRRPSVFEDCVDIGSSVAG
jgi:hypothetical protein